MSHNDQGKSEEVPWKEELVAKMNLEEGKTFSHARSSLASGSTDESLEKHDHVSLVETVNELSCGAWYIFRVVARAAARSQSDSRLSTAKLWSSGA